MADMPRSDIALSVLAAASGIIGVIGFLTGYALIGWIGVTGFVVVLIWLIGTSPAGLSRGDSGTSFGLWHDGGGSYGAAGGGDGGGGG